MTEYLAGKAPTEEELNEWIEFFHANGFVATSRARILAPAHLPIQRFALVNWAPSLRLTSSGSFTTRIA